MKRAVHLTSDSPIFVFKPTLLLSYACLCVSERGGEKERERLQLSTCQPFALLSCQPPPAGARYPMVQNREGLGKPLFPLSALHLHLPASAHHSWVGSVRQTATEPLYDILSALSPIKSRIHLGWRTGSCLTSEHHMLEFTRTASAKRFWICGLCAPLSLWGSKVTSPGLVKAMITQKQRRQTYTLRSCIISTCHTDARHHGTSGASSVALWHLCSGAQLHERQCQYDIAQGCESYKCSHLH